MTNIKRASKQKLQNSNSYRNFTLVTELYKPRIKLRSAINSWGLRKISWWKMKTYISAVGQMTMNLKTNDINSYLARYVRYIIYACNQSINLKINLPEMFTCIQQNTWFGRYKCFYHYAFLSLWHNTQTRYLFPVTKMNMKMGMFIITSITLAVREHIEGSGRLIACKQPSNNSPKKAIIIIVAMQAAYHSS